VTHGLWDELWAVYTARSLDEGAALQAEQQAVARYLAAAGEHSAADLVASSRYDVTYQLVRTGQVRAVTLGFSEAELPGGGTLLRSVERALNQLVSPHRHVVTVAEIGDPPPRCRDAGRFARVGRRLLNPRQRSNLT
jgi:hypothetical protein